MHDLLPAARPALPAPTRQPRPRAGLKPIISRTWLVVFALLLIATAAAAMVMIQARIATIDRTIHGLVAEQLLTDALRTTQRLRLATAQPPGPDTARTMDQDLLRLSEMTRLPPPSPLPGYQPSGSEVGALRTLLLQALGEMRPLRAAPDATALLAQHLARLEAQIERLRSQAAATALREAERMAETARTPLLVRGLIGAMALLLLAFLVILLRRAAELRASHAELAAWADDTDRLMAAIPGVLVRSRRDHNGVWMRGFVGEAISTLTGHSVEEARGYGWLRHNIATEDLSALFQAFDEALAGTPRSAIIRFRHREGRWIWVKLMMGRHVDGDGTPELLTLWSDATREREMSERLAHTAKLAHMGELMTGMAHELNQPLTSISLAAENATRLAEREPLDSARLRAKLEVVVAMAARAAALVERLREFVREDETPKVPLRLEPLVAAALRVMGNRLRLAAMEVQLDIPADLPQVLGRATPLERVFTQLLTNACDAYAAREAPPAPPRLAITARAEGRMVRVTVQDEAGGIPDELLPRIFEPFFTTKPVGAGTGLGLSSSFGIMAEIGGSISAENEAGGARFTLLLPRA